MVSGADDCIYTGESRCVESMELGTALHRRLHRVTTLQETTDRRIALETNRDLIRLARVVTRARLRQQLRARRPVWLVFGDACVDSDIRHHLLSRRRPANLRNGEGTIDRDDRRAGQRVQRVVEQHHVRPIRLTGLGTNTWADCNAASN